MKKKKADFRKKSLPRFESVSKESDFWDKHNPLDYGPWKEISYEELLNDLKSQSVPKRQVSLRLEPELIESLKKTAKEYRIPYQKLARELIKRGIGALSKIQS